METKSKFWNGVIANTLGVLIAALFIGFFGLLYEKSSKYDELSRQFNELKKEVASSEERIIQEVAKNSLSLSKTTFAPNVIRLPTTVKDNGDSPKWISPVSESTLEGKDVDYFLKKQTELKNKDR